MKVVILAGGRGTRISEETQTIPKPMVRIGGKPILWHIMKTYSHYGFNEFVICLGYKSYMIKEYFSHYFLHTSDVTIDLRKQNEVEVHTTVSEPWKITLVDTGAQTMTGGRVKRIREYVGDQTFLLTYGDGLTNLDIRKALQFHRKHGKIMTVTSVQPGGRFGILDLGENDRVRGFHEKPKGGQTWINAGYFIAEPEIFSYLGGDDTVLEQKPMQKLAQKGELYAFRHSGFWHPMDTLRDKIHLDELWDSDKAPWKVWKDPA